MGGAVINDGRQGSFGADPMEQRVGCFVLESITHGATDSRRVHPTQPTKHTECLRDSVFRPPQRARKVADVDAGRTVEDRRISSRVGSDRRSNRWDQAAVSTSAMDEVAPSRCSEPACSMPQHTTRAGPLAVSAHHGTQQGLCTGRSATAQPLWSVASCKEVSSDGAGGASRDLCLDLTDVLAGYVSCVSYLPLSGPRPTPQCGWMADLLTALVLLVMASTPAALMAALSYRCAPLPLARRGRRMTQVRHHRPGQPVG